MPSDIAVEYRELAACAGKEESFPPSFSFWYTHWIDVCLFRPQASFRCHRCSVAQIKRLLSCLRCSRMRHASIMAIACPLFEQSTRIRKSLIPEKSNKAIAIHVARVMCWARTL